MTDAGGMKGIEREKERVAVMQVQAIPWDFVRTYIHIYTSALLPVVDLVCKLYRNQSTFII